MASKVIFHIDMNCFFLSCELINRPDLIGIPSAVTGNHKVSNSMILSASYEARKKGVHVTMLNGDAKKLCPEIVLLDMHYGLYEKVSNEIMKYFFSITPFVEIGSIDEAYLDVTDVISNNDYLSLAKHIQDYLLNFIKIPCSIGIGPNKFLAKMGSDYKKPLGITVIRKRDAEKMLYPLPISDMYGLGKKSAQLLNYLGIKTIGDIVNFKYPDTLIDVIGKNAYDYYISRAHGEGSDKVIPTGKPDYDSMSHDYTMEKHITDPKEAYPILKDLASVVSNRLEEYEHYACSVNIKIKYDTFKVTSRQKTLSKPSYDLNDIYLKAKDLFDEYYDCVTPIRMLSVGVSKLVPVKQEIKQLSLFDDLEIEEQDLKIKNLIKELNNKLGDNVISLGINKNKK